MIAIETNRRAPAERRSRPALEIRFQFVDGSRETFIQPDAKRAEVIQQGLNPFHLFNQARIVVAEDYSKSVFVSSQINRVDFVFKGVGFSHVPADHADLVELTEAEFRKHVPLNNPSRLQKRMQLRQVGDLPVSFLDLRMRGGRCVYLMNETLVKLPADSQSYMQRFLSKSESSSLLATGRVLGQSLSVALAGAIFASRGGAEAGRDRIGSRMNHSVVEGAISATQLQFLTGFHTALLVCAGIAAAGIFAALIRGPETESTVRAVSTTRAKQPQNQNAIPEASH